MCRFGLWKEIFAGFDRHLLFTIYDLLFTIIVLTTNRRFFINDVCLVQPEKKFRVPNKMNRSTENEHFRVGTEGEAGHPMMVDAA